MSGCEDAAKGMAPADGSVRVEEGKKSPVTGVVVDCTPGGMYSSTKSPTGAMNRLTASIKLTNPSKDNVSFTVHVDGSPIRNSSTKATDIITMEGGSYKTFTYLAPEENSAMGSCMAMTVTTHTAKSVTGFTTK